MPPVKPGHAAFFVIEHTADGGIRNAEPSKIGAACAPQVMQAPVVDGSKRLVLLRRLAKQLIRPRLGLAEAADRGSPIAREHQVARVRDALDNLQSERR